MATQFQIDCALMAGSAYQSNRDKINWFPAPSGWQQFSHVPNSAYPTISGFEASAFQNIATGGIVISFAGTEPKSLSDWQANIGLANGFGSDQLTQAVDYYLAVKAANRNADITFTGHSLGGGLAALMGVFFGQQAITFDQAPFAESATWNLLRPNVAANLKQYLLDKTLSDPNQVAVRDEIVTNLGNFLTLRDANGGIPNSGLVTTIRVDGEFLGAAPYMRIGTPPETLTHGDYLGPIDLHSQTLLSAFLQSNQSAAIAGIPQQTLSEVTKKLADLLGMMFDKKLYAFDTDKADENFLERLVRHEAGNAPLASGGTVTADAMVTRFTQDLWKIAQDGGLSLNESIGMLQTYSNWNNVSNTLIAFAMQKYYDEKAGSLRLGQTLFDAISGGIQFDTAAVVGEGKSITDAKGFDLYFKNYLSTTGGFSAAERSLINALLPILRDWTVQAGADGLLATDTLNRNAFLLGGSGSDALVGGTGADLLVGNGGADLLQGGQGNDILLGGKGNDAYVYSSGDGLDIILDTEGQNTLAVDGDILNGGAQYGDALVHRSADGKHLYVDAGNNTLLIDGNLAIEKYASNGFGLTLGDALPEDDPQTTQNIGGDIKPDDISADDGIQAVRVNGVLVGTSQPYEDIIVGTADNEHIQSGDLDDNIGGRGGDDWIEAGSGRDYALGDEGNDLIEGGAGGDILAGGDGKDRLYGDSKISTIDAIANGRTDTATGQKGDWLSGNAGDDILVAGADNDVLAGGAGNDLLIAGAGDDFILGDAEYTPTFIVETDARYSVGDDECYHTSNVPFDWTVTELNNVFTFSPTDDVYDPPASGADVIYAGAGNDHVWGGAGNDVIFGEGGIDTIVGEAGNDVIFGGDDGDVISGDGSYLAANLHGADWIDGGAGDDTIYGNGGDDIIIGGKDDDTIYGGAGRDTYIYNKGDGEDKIYDDDTGPDKSILIFGEGVAKDAIKLRKGSLMLDLGNGDAVHIEKFDADNPLGTQSFASFQFADGTSLNWGELLARGFDLDGTEGDDTIFGTGVDDRIDGKGGNDLIWAGEGNDILTGGTGTDGLNGGLGDDIYLFKAGDSATLDGTASGQAETLVDTGGSDTLRFAADVDPRNLVLRDNLDGSLLIDYNAVGQPLDRLLVADGLSGTIEHMEVGAGDTARTFSFTQFVGEYGNGLYNGSDAEGRLHLTGGRTADTVYSGDGNAVVSGGRGDDTLRVYGANNTIQYSIGDGADSIWTNGVANSGNVLRLSGVIADDLKLGLDSFALQVGGDPADTIHFQNFDQSDVFALRPFEHIDFDDGSSLSYDELMAKGFDITGTDEDDELNGTNVDDRIVAASGDDSLRGGAGNDVLKGGDGSDVLDGGTGNDTLEGGGGFDTYRLGLGGGQDLVIENMGEGGEIRIDGDLSFAALKAVMTGNDAVVSIRATGDSLRLTDVSAASNWQIVQVDGQRMGLADLVAASTPAGNSLAQVWADTKVRAWQDLSASQSVAGWLPGHSAAGQVTYSSYGPARLTATEQTTTYIYHSEFGLVDTAIVSEYSAGAAMVFPWGDTSRRLTIAYGERQIMAGSGTTYVGPTDVSVLAGSRAELLTVAWGQQENFQTASSSGVWTNSPVNGYTEWFRTIDSRTQQGKVLSATPVASIPLGQYGVLTGNQVYLSVPYTEVAESLITEVFGDVGDNTIHADGNASGGYVTVQHLDLVDGGAGNDLIFGDGGDLLYGNDGDDRVFGTDGSQTLIGGKGNDFLNGGAGGDVYRMLNEDGVDTIVDVGSDDVDGARYAAMGIDMWERSWRENYGGRWAAWGAAPPPGWTDFAGVTSWLTSHGYDVSQMLSDGELVYIEPLPALPPLHANDHRQLETYYGSVIETDRVVLGAGVTPDNIRVSGNDDTGYLRLDMPDGTGLRVALAGANDYLGSGVELFEFANGTVLTIGDLVDRMNAAHVMAGTTGDDVFVTGAGNDVLYGGGGDDSLAGGGGDDVYLFHRGDGHDVVSQGGALVSDHDVIRFTDDIVPGDVAVTRDADGVHLTLSDGADSIRILQQPGEAPLPAVEFADGTYWDAAVFAAVPLQVSGTPGDDILGGTAGIDVMDGGAGNDTLTGGAGDDVFLFGRGDGVDTLTLPAAGAADRDIIRFKAGVAPGDVVLSRDWSGLHIAIEGTTDAILIPGQFGQLALPSVEFADGAVWNSSVLADVRLSKIGTDGADTLIGGPDAELIRGLGGNDQLWGYAGDDVLQGGDGADQLYGGAGNDIFDGGAGNDLLASEAGDDVYLFGRGDGADTVVVSTGSGGNDVLRFKQGVAPGDVTLVRQFGGYRLTINDTADSIYLGSGVPLTRVEFSDGTFWDGTVLSSAPALKQGTSGSDSLVGTADADVLLGLAGNDFLFGGDGNDVLDGGAGNDELHADAGNDIFLFGRGDGSDVIYQSGALPGDQDVIRFKAGVRPSDVMLSRDGTTDNGGVRLTIADSGDSIGIAGQGWIGLGSYNVPCVEFADGTVWGADILRAMPLATDAGDELAGTAANDIIDGRGGADQMDGQGGNDRLLGGDGGDTIFGNAGNDTLIGGTGYDWLTGGAGNDVYIFARGDGSDTIDLSGNGEDEIDVIRFAPGISAEDLRVFRDVESGESLVIELGSSNAAADGGEGGGEGGEVPVDCVTLLNWFDGGPRSARVEFDDGTVWDAQTLTAMAPEEINEIVGSADSDEINGTSRADAISGLEGNDLLWASNGDDTLIGGVGDDDLFGGAGNDIYVFNRGDGWDRVYQYNAGDSDTDTIRFGEGIAPADVMAGSRNGDLVLLLGADGEGMQLIDPFDGILPSVEFADGTIWDAASLQAARTQVLGTADGEFLGGGSGDDTIFGFGGDDTLYGYEGNDTYVFNRGDGWDTVSQAMAGGEDVDVVGFGAGICGEDILVGRSGDDLVLALGDSGDGLLLEYWFDSETPVAAIEFANGTSWDASLLGELAAESWLIVGSSWSEMLPGSDEADTILGLAGNDYLAGYGGDDRLLGGIGNDFLSGDGGDDTLIGGPGSDTLIGGPGTDTYIFRPGDGQDAILTYAETDDGEAVGTDVIRFGAGIAVADVMASARADEGEVSVELSFRNDGEMNGIKIFGSLDELPQLVFDDGRTIDPDQLLAMVLSSQGSPWDDALIGTSGDDEMDGEEGSDVLFGRAGDDVLAGGEDDDVLCGGAGNDIYLFNPGDGNDLIDNRDGGSDVIRFGAGIATGDVVFGYDGDGEVYRLSIGEGDDSIRIMGDPGSLPGIEFADGTVWSATDLIHMLAQTAPVLDDELANQDALADEPFEFSIPAETFFDADAAAGDRLSFTASLADGTPLPAWLAFDAETLTFSGTPHGADAGALDLRVTATDLAGNSVAGGFTVTVTGNNSAPMLANAVADLTATQDLAFSWTVPANAFIDSDAGDRLSYAVTATDGTPLPAWLGFDTATRHLSGTPGAGTPGTLALRVMATDTGGLSAVAEFALAVGPHLRGTASSDTLNYSASSFVGIAMIDGGAGNDAIAGSAGNDVIVGGTGSDNLNGGAGDDVFLITGTDSGYDRFEGGTGYDVIRGSTSDDTIRMYQYTGAATVERIEGDGGIDIIAGTGSSDTLDFSGTELVGIALIDGGAGNDAITGSAGNDVIVGGTGSDNLNGGAGDDVFLVTGTDTGYDRFEGGVGFDVIRGSTGDDTIRMYQYTGAATVERIDGNGGLDVIAGTGSSDTLDFSATELVGIALIDGGAGNDDITGSAGDDIIVGGTGSDNLNGGAGDDVFLITGIDSGYDRFEGGAGFDVIRGSTGDDTIRMYQYTGAATVERIEGGGGNDIIAGTGSSDTLDFSGTELVGIALIDGGAGNDDITGSAGDDGIVGGTGSDNLNGGAGDDVFLITGTDSGYDRFEGGAGFDVIRGSSGDDTIRMYQYTGTATVERIEGGGGVDVITGTGSSDTLDFSATELVGIAMIDGGAGNDAITGSAGNDIIIGGTGSDNLNGGAGDDVFLITGTDSGYDRFEGGASFDVIRGSTGDDIIRMYQYTGTATVERIEGGGGVDVITGTGSSDTLDFSATELVGIAMIDGGAGNDAITGSAGNDIIIGGTGSDRLTGGLGSDTYRMGLGDGADTLVENDATAGNTDVAEFLTGIRADQIWLRHLGNNLEASIIGTTDKLMVQNWYLGPQYHVEQFKTADGKLLLDSQVENLVQAMAAFAPPGAGQTSLPPIYQDSLAPVIAANWQ